jgi:hypothetical protein
MSKYETKYCEGYWEDEPERLLYPVKIALGEWDEVEDLEDQEIFYYMDGEPLKVGSVVADGFVITEIEETENA